MKDLAIIFAGGKGKRMNNYSQKPKHLIKINELPIIEHIIQALQKSKKVAHILVITGYLSHYFNYLEKKYSHLTLFYNENYASPLISRLWVDLNKFWRKNQNWLLITGDMILYENYFQNNIPLNTMAGFYHLNKKKEKMPFYRLNSNNYIVDVKLTCEQNNWTLGEFSRIDNKIIKAIIRANQKKDKEKEALLCYESLIKYSIKCKMLLKIHVLKWQGPTDIDNSENLRKVRKIFSKRVI